MPSPRSTRFPSSAFHDVTSGFNGYSARSGYDLVTGLGTPVASQVIAGLLGARGSPAWPPSRRGRSRTRHRSFSARPIFVLATDSSQGDEQRHRLDHGLGRQLNDDLDGRGVQSRGDHHHRSGPPGLVIFLPPVTELAFPIAANVISSRRSSFSTRSCRASPSARSASSDRAGSRIA